MQFFMSAVSSLFTNPYGVREVQLSEYSRGSDTLKEEGRIVLYKNGSSWDCLLKCPDTPMTALRLFQVSSEADALNWFPHYALKLRPFYEILPLLNPEVVQPIVDSLRSHPDWSSAHIAVDTGLKECLKHNYVQSQINARDGSGQTPLHLACDRGDVGCVRALLEECQARTDVKDKNGETPMHCAAKQDTPAIIQALCSRMCAGVNELNGAGETPLHVACRLGKVEAVNALLGGGARCDIIGERGYAIHSAMKYSEKGCCEAILKADPAQLHVEDAMYGGTPLHWCKTAEMCRMLLDNGCKVNHPSKTGESPLHILTRRGRFEASMVLLTHGADPNLRGMDGNTSLHLAMKMDQLDLIKALIVFGADVEMPNDLGETPRLLACCASKGSNRKVLLEMLYSVGVQRCAPPFSPLDPQPRSTPRSVASPPGIGFENIMDVSASMGAMSRGLVEVDTVKPKRERLLCLDGGGIRGLVLIQLLIALEKEAGRPIKELFDWISGTSTGGILALAIVHGKDMEYLRCLYFRMKEQVFQGSRPYESAPLEHFLKKEFGENTMMTDVRHPRVMVTSVLADRHPGELHIFRNYDPPSPPQELPAFIHRQLPAPHNTTG
ncbi:hypothetical protein UPYG_G00062630 [Umbra pygmaea]|uniref:phospholipase A2 n=1 Tax=Umbra pygmaea TaxID=75934 RepID=A0ABD0XX50_UMBPY